MYRFLQILTFKYAGISGYSNKVYRMIKAPQHFSLNNIGKRFGNIYVNISKWWVIRNIHVLLTTKAAFTFSSTNTFVFPSPNRSCRTRQPRKTRWDRIPRCPWTHRSCSIRRKCSRSELQSLWFCLHVVMIYNNNIFYKNGQLLLLFFLKA